LPEWALTDAFVAKLDATAAVVWTSVYDARTNMVSTGQYPYFRRQECLYDIAEAEDGGLAIAGNNSSNLDDSYVVRLQGGASPTLPGPTVSHSHLVFPTQIASPTVTFTGDLTVNSTGRAEVDPVRTLRFGAGARALAFGTLTTDGATLTATNPAQKWAGVVAANGIVGLTGGSVQHATTGVAGYEPAVVTITGTTLSSNTTGLDVRTRAGVTVAGGHITGNGTGVRSDFLACYGTSCPCFTNCRSTFSLRDNPATGARTTISGNAGVGMGAQRRPRDHLHGHREQRGEWHSLG
jgi:hypothetical protein